MRRIKISVVAAIIGSLLAACGGTPAPSAVPIASPSIPPVPVVTLPTLPGGWVRYEAPGAFTVGAPSTWLVLTTTERDDPAAGAALKARRPDYAQAIDSAVAQMREQGIYLHAYDVAGDTTAFTTNMNIVRVPGPLSAEFARTAAATVQAQFKIADPLTVETATSPVGAYRYQFAENLVGDSLAGMQYLIPAGSDVFIMTFLTTVDQTESYGSTAVGMADTFAAATAGSAIATPAPAATAPVAASPAPATAAALVVQGESAKLQGAGQYTLVSDTSNVAATHGGYLYLGDGRAKAIFTVAIPTDGTYFVWMRVSDDGLHADGARSVSVAFGDAAKDWVNQSRDTKGWVYEALGSIPITKGALTVTFTKLETTTAAFSMDEFVLSTDPAYDPSAPAASAEPAAGGSEFDPQSGVALDVSVADACVLLPLEIVASATGYPGSVVDPTYFRNACRYLDPVQADAATSVNRYVDASHALAAMKLRATTPSATGRGWVAIPGYGDAAYATGNGEIIAVSRNYLAMVNVAEVGPQGAGTLTEVAKILIQNLLANVDRL